MDHILDLDRFPLDRPDSAQYAQLLQRCRDDLTAEGMFSLDGFMMPEVAQEVADTIAEDMRTASFHHERLHNIYFQDHIDGLADDHPALAKFATSNHTLCADQLAGTAIAHTYEFAPLRAFLADAMGMTDLHEMADPLARLNVMSYGPGDALNWHFDRSEFTVTLLLQAPDAGGVFEYRTGLRSQRDPNYAGVSEVLRGRDPQVKQIALSPGTLNVFRGVNTAHRVTPVQGDRRRVIAVLSYFDRPGVRFSPQEQHGFYGRTA